VLVAVFAVSAPVRAAKSRLTSDRSEKRADHRKLLLSTGEDKAVDISFDVAGANGINVGNTQVVAVQLVKLSDTHKQLVFKPLKKGDTTVVVRDPDGTIQLIFNVRVSDSNLLREAAEIRDLLKDIEGIDIRIVGHKIVVDGEVLVPADYARLLAVTLDASYAPDVMSLTTLSPIAMQMLAKRIQQDINAFAPNVKTRVVNGMIFLEGTVDNFDQAERAKEVAKLYLPEVKPGNPLLAKDPTAAVIPNRSLVQNFIVINPPAPKRQEKLVRVTFHFVELAKDYLKSFGFSWTPGFTADPSITLGTGVGGTAGASGGASFTATISSLFPRLTNAQNAGFARVLKTSTVVVRSGQKAFLSNTTNYPTTVMTSNGPSAGTPVTTGLEATVVPQILGQSEDIQLQLEINQMSPSTQGLNGQTGVTNHKVQTFVYVKSNESAAVAGLESSDVGTAFNRAPSSGSFDPNSQTRPLVNLLHSKEFHKDKSQFVIFVTPQIIDNASDGTEDLKKNFRVKVK
jgi:pilus assembly protein CpaC